LDLLIIFIFWNKFMIFNEMETSVDSMMIKIHNQSFNQELSNGSLAKEKFIHYLIQDALYLADFSRALALTGARLTDNRQTQQFIHFAMGSIQAERDLHATYLKNLSSQIIANAEQTPACFMYTNYLFKTAIMATVEEAADSLLPCFWIYREVGKNILSAQIHSFNPYQNWITLYAGEEFHTSVEVAITIINQLGEHASSNIKSKMISAFIRSTQLEWMFWESAYCQESWPLLIK